MAQFEIFLLLGIAIGIVSIIRIFSSAVDGTRPRISVLFLFVAIGLYYYAGRLAGKTLGPTDITTALANMFSQVTG